MCFLHPWASLGHTENTDRAGQSMKQKAKKNIPVRWRRSGDHANDWRAPCVNNKTAGKVDIKAAQKHKEIIFPLSRSLVVTNVLNNLDFLNESTILVNRKEIADYQINQLLALVRRSVPCGTDFLPKVRRVVRFQAAIREN